MTRFFREKFWVCYFPLSLLYWELLLKLWCFDALPTRGLVLTALFSLAAGCLLTFLCALRPGNFQRRLTNYLLIACAVLFCTQAVYFKIFKTFLSLNSLGGAGTVLSSFWREALTGIVQSLPVIIPMLLPVILWLLFRARLCPRRIAANAKILLIVSFAIFQLVAVGAVLGSSSGVISPQYLYFESYVPEHTVRYFGAVTNLRLDIRNMISPRQPETSVPAGPSSTTSPAPAETDTPSTYAPNVLEIDWESLIEQEPDATIREMHQFFSQRTPSSQNEYTGMFAGKNLIWVVAEGFSSWAVDKELTPTLYQLSQEGFQFKNFYNPLWYVSTSDGEFTTLLSLLPRSGVWSMSKSSSCDMPFAMGNLMGGEGYNCYAFHNGTLTYYDRDKSHPNLGYDFKADGAGLSMTSSWPASDLEMIQQSTPLFLDNQPFHTYYLTISGHMNYNFYGNNMAAKHQDAVADLPYSEAARAYVACNIELDLAMEQLLDDLEEAGILEDTVIVLSGDHYPYGLTQSEIEELNGGPVEQNFELYRSSLFLYCADMKAPVQVEKYCCAMDILPTLCNLFGLEYDSRLYMGSDILSDSEPLIIFGNRSFITAEGRYNATTDSFVPAEGSQADNSYAAGILEQINRMFQYSANIIDLNYYGKVAQSLGS